VEQFQILLRDTLIVTAALSLPVLALATAIGAAVAIVQAATQIQEQTLTLLPKLVAVGVAIAFGGAFGMQLCEQLMREAVDAMPALVAGP
jgi:flagellar biosynthetic protein FliQ